MIAQGYDNAAAAARIYQDFLSAEQRYPWVLDQASNQIVMALVFTEASGSSDILAAMQWRELR